MYEIQLNMRSQSQALVQKRYRDIRNLYESVISTQLLPIIRSQNLKLPKFPEKALFKMNSELVNKRRIELELWLNDAVKLEPLSLHIFSFLNLNIKPKNKVSGSEQIFDFIEKINSSSKNRMKLIENFE